MDVRAFLSVVNKYKWVLIIVPLIATATTYFLVQNMPKKYKSQVRIATGLVDPSKQLAMSKSTDFFTQSQHFGNIMEMMKMKKIMSLLSYNLILHDLENPKQAFREESETIKKLNPKDRQAVIESFQTMLANGKILSLSDNEGKYRLVDIVNSMGYGERDFEEKLSISRQDNSDFIDVDFVSESPLLSAYVVNTFANEFLYTYSANVNHNQEDSMLLLDSLLKEKEKVMNEKNAALKSFKMNNGVLNVSAQSEMVYAQISSNEELRARAIREIQSLTGAIAGIDARLNDSRNEDNRKALVSDNTEIVALKNQIQAANERYVDNNFRAEDKRYIDELQDKLSGLIASSSLQVFEDPKSNRQSLIRQKMDMQISLDLAKNSLASINRELGQANARYNKMVPFDAGILNYERDAEVATKDYLETLNKSSQTSMESNTGLKLQVAQIGLPGPAEPSKEILYVAISGVSTLFVCLIALLIGFLLDNTVNTSEQLEMVTGSPVMGQLNIINETSPSIKRIWGSNLAIREYNIHKDLLRSIRFELDRDFGLNGCKILGVTSISDGVGKSFLSSSLAYAFAKTNRKILLISEVDLGKNIAKNGEKELVPHQTFEKFLMKREIQIEDLITVLNINPNRDSLFEVQSIHNLKLSFEELKNEFDIIIIDIESLKEVNKAKEWLLFVDKVIAVFKAGNEVKYADQKKIDYLKNHKGFMGWILNKSRLNGVTKIA
jgi:capsular polysaccharide biosynthesis protein